MAHGQVLVRSVGAIRKPVAHLGRVDAFATRTPELGVVRVAFRIREVGERTAPVIGGLDDVDDLLPHRAGHQRSEATRRGRVATPTVFRVVDADSVVSPRAVGTGQRARPLFQTLGFYFLGANVISVKKEKN